MKPLRRGWAAAWRERGRNAGFFLLLAALCVGLGLLIALPLWLFATREPRIYTGLALTLMAAGVLALVVRAAVRRSRRPREPAAPGHPVLAGILTTIATLLGIACLYSAAALLVRALWITAFLAVAAGALVVWLLVFLRSLARKPRKVPGTPAENRSR